MDCLNGTCNAHDSLTTKFSWANQRAAHSRNHKGIPPVRPPRRQVRRVRLRSRTLLAALVLLLGGGGVSKATEATSLVDAITSGDRAAVRRLLQSRTAVTDAAPDGTTPLHAAAFVDDAETVAALLRAGALPNVTTRYGVTPLSLAALNGSASVTKQLLAAGAEVGVALAEGQTILMTAARTGNPEVVRLLLAAGADPNARERVAGETALIWAALEDHGDVVRALAAGGADLNGRSTVATYSRFKFGDGIVARPTVLPKGGWTPLMYAARQNAGAAARALVDAGADADAVDPDGTTALVFAVINGHYDVAAMLVERGADPNVADASGMAALYAAVDMHTLDETVGRPNPTPHGRVGIPALVRLMLERGARADATLTGPVLERMHNDGDPALAAGATPLMRAAKDADVTLMRLLLDRGASVHATTKSGRTPLMYAAGRQSGFRGSPNRGTEAQALEAVALCLDRGADIDRADETGQTALHLAAVQAEDSIIALLGKRGANVRALDGRGRTPLDLATGGGRGRGGARGTAAALLKSLMEAEPTSRLPR